MFCTQSIPDIKVFTIKQLTFGIVSKNLSKKFGNWWIGNQAAVRWTTVYLLWACLKQQRMCHKDVETIKRQLDLIIGLLM